MKSASFVVPEAYLANRQFDLSDKRLNRDDCLYPFALLKAELEARGIAASTHDICPPERADLVICNEMPSPMLSDAVQAKKILLLFETDVIRPDNWNLPAHECFDAVFTWDDRFAGRGKYRKFHFPNKVPDGFESVARKPRDRLCTLIAGNKVSRNPAALYSERVRAAEWFERHHPGDFDLYGMGWDVGYFKGILRPFNRVPAARKAFAPRRPSYRGPVESKLSAYSGYKFAICYENVTGLDGYVTEKIFDCLFAGCVPVYLGAANIARYVPEECFIRRERFGSYEELYDFLAGMPESDRLDYVEAGIRFVTSKQMLGTFNPIAFAGAIADCAAELLSAPSL